MNSKISLQELAQGLSKRKNKTKKEAEAFVHAVFDVIEEYVKADSMVKVKGIGLFKLTTVDSRESVNVNTGERMVIDTHARISFTPHTTLRDTVNKPFADFETVVLNDNTRTEDMEYVPEPEGEPEEEKTQEEKTQETDMKEETEPQPEQETATEQTEEKPLSTPEQTKEETQGLYIQQAVAEAVERELHRRGGVFVSWGGVAAYVLITLLLVAGSFLMGYKCGGHLLHSNGAMVPTPAPKAPTEKPMTPAQPKKKAPAAKPDTTTVHKTTETTQPQRQEENYAEKYPQVEGGEYWIVGTKKEHKIKVGDNLLTLSIGVYGNKKFADYIIKYNSIANPDILPLGDTIKLPELKKKE